MALTFNQVSAITHFLIDNKLADNVYNSNALLARLSRPGKLDLKDGGRAILEPVISSAPTVGGYYDDLDTLASDRSDNITSAQFEWKQLFEPVRISRKELLQNSGKSAALSLIKSKVMIAEKNLRDNLGKGLFSDGTVATGALSANQLTGLAAVVSATSTYGGIAVADMAAWAANITANGGTARAITMSLMQAVYGACSEGSDKPSALICLQNVFDQIWALFQPHQRFVSSEMSKLGFENVLTFNGAPILVDSHSVAGEVLFINEDYLKLCVHKDENLRKETMESLETTNSMLIRMHWMGNLVCSNRRFQGKLDDVETA